MQDFDFLLLLLLNLLLNYIRREKEGRLRSGEITKHLCLSKIQAATSASQCTISISSGSSVLAVTLNPGHECLLNDCGKRLWLGNSSQTKIIKILSF